MVRTIKPLDEGDVGGRRVMRPPHSLEVIRAIEKQPVQPDVPAPERTAVPLTQGRYLILTGDTYQEGLDALEKYHCEGELGLAPVHSFNTPEVNITRPLTAKETIQEKVHDYETLTGADGNPRLKAQRLWLFNKDLDTCTALASPGGKMVGGSQVMPRDLTIVPICEQLLAMPDGFVGTELAIAYSQFAMYTKVARDGLYNRQLSLQQVLEHPGWLALVEGDRDLLRTYADIIFAEGSNPSMIFGTDRTPNEQDLVLPIFLGSLSLARLSDGDVNTTELNGLSIEFLAITVDK